MEQHHLLKTASHHQSYKLLADGPPTPSRFTSEKTLSSSRHCFSAKPHTLHLLTSTLWMPDYFTEFFSFITYRLFYLLTDFSCPQQMFLLHPYIRHEHSPATWTSPHNMHVLFCPRSSHHSLHELITTLSTFSLLSYIGL